MRRLFPLKYSVRSLLLSLSSVFLVESFSAPPAVVAMSSSSFSDPLLVVIGLNPALQKRFVISNHGKNLIPGQVHRASHVQTGVGGKGQDVAIAFKCLQPGTTRIRLVQFLGSGAEGDQVYQLLLDQMEEAVQATTLRVQTSLRTCTSIVGKHETTELVEPSGTISSVEIQQLLDLCQQQQQQQQVSSSPKQIQVAGICIMGSMPPGCPPTLYADLYQRWTSSSATTLCVMDSVVGIAPMFQALSGPILYKVNRHELCALAGIALDDEESAALSDILEAFCSKFRPPKEYLKGIAITNGRHPGHLCWQDQSTDKWQIATLEIPPLQEESETPLLLYPIGAGDAVAAGTLAAWMTLSSHDTLPASCQTALQAKMKALQETIPVEACDVVTSFVFGLACGSASKYLRGLENTCQECFYGRFSNVPFVLFLVPFHGFQAVYKKKTRFWRWTMFYVCLRKWAFLPKNKRHR